MKKGFTIVEVSILFVIFLIVAVLVAPLSLDDTRQAKNTSRWRNVQEDFSNIFYSVDSLLDEKELTFKEAIERTFSGEIKNEITSYKINYMNGAYPANAYHFDKLKSTYSNAVFSVKMFAEDSNNDLQGILMYDVNGITKPNTWGKDVFGLNIYKDRFEPFCKNEPINKQKQDCSKNGTGLCCSNYYLIGGNFD